jgi:phenylacetate-CoA ligase
MLRECIFGPSYFMKRRLIRRTEYSGAKNLLRIQGQMLANLMNYAINNIPYYNNLTDLKSHSGNMDPEELLKNFPIINKEWIRSRLLELVAGNRLKRLKGTTGGSTGQPMVFYIDRFFTRQAEKAFMFDQWSRIGYKFGDKIYNIRGRTPKKSKFIHHDKIFNIYFASSFDLTAKNLSLYIDSINAIKPDFLHGYPSTIYQLAVMIESDRRRPDHRVKAVLCCSEKLFDFQRDKIESVFGCRVYTWYGHSEYLALGGACEHSNTLHFYPQYGYTELISTGLCDKKGNKIFEIVATGFNNRVMPMIRYQTGDYAIKSDRKQCRCGRDYLLIDEVIGRIQEFVVDAQEQLISATSLLFGQHYQAFEDVSAAQFYQDTPGKLNILVVKNENCREHLIQEMKKQMELLLGNRMQITITYVDNIQKSEIGKARTVIQKLPIHKYFA